MTCWIQLHLAKLAKETVELTRGDDLKNILHRSEQREQQLNTMIETLESRHRQAISELEEMLTSQTSLVQKLQEECRLLAAQLEDITVKYRRDNKQLKSQNVQLKTRQDRALRQLRELQDQNTQHSCLQEKMRERLRQLDAHAYKSGQQILELLSKESCLMKERQVLAREVEFLRTQLTRNGTDVNVLCSSHTGAVNDILGNVRNEMVSAGNDDTDAILERRAEKSRNLLRNELVKLKLSYEDKEDKPMMDVGPHIG
ncbi:hypothetical protein LSAT2_012033 [Lamellibrachia satsuma]|nr:hypothetical protein LSAT2_012033 [Lamellibrachia satsuma]